MAADENQTYFDDFYTYVNFTVYEAFLPHRMLIRKGKPDADIQNQGWAVRLAFEGADIQNQGFHQFSSGINPYFGVDGSGHFAILEHKNPVHRSIIVPPENGNRCDQVNVPNTHLLQQLVADGWTQVGGFLSHGGGKMKCLYGEAHDPLRGMIIANGVSPCDGWVGKFNL